MITTIEYVGLSGQALEHICLEGKIEPLLTEGGLFKFANENETFYVPVNRLVSIDIFEPERTDPAQLTLVEPLVSVGAN